MFPGGNYVCMEFMGNWGMILAGFTEQTDRAYDEILTHNGARFEH